MKRLVLSLLLFCFFLNESTSQSLSSAICKEDFMEVQFSRVSGDAVCQVRLSDESMKTDGLVLVDKFSVVPKAYCLNPGYYYLSLIQI